MRAFWFVISLFKTAFRSKQTTVLSILSVLSILISIWMFSLLIEAFKIHSLRWYDYVSVAVVEFVHVLILFSISKEQINFFEIIYSVCCRGDLLDNASSDQETLDYGS